MEGPHLDGFGFQKQFRSYQIESEEARGTQICQEFLRGRFKASSVTVELKMPLGRFRVSDVFNAEAAQVFRCVSLIRSVLYFHK